MWYSSAIPVARASEAIQEPALGSKDYSSNIIATAFFAHYATCTDLAILESTHIAVVSKNVHAASTTFTMHTSRIVEIVACCKSAEATSGNPVNSWWIDGFGYTRRKVWYSEYIFAFIFFKTLWRMHDSVGDEDWFVCYALTLPNFYFQLQLQLFCLNSSLVGKLHHTSFRCMTPSICYWSSCATN